MKQVTFNFDEDKAKQNTGYDFSKDYDDNYQHLEMTQFLSYTVVRDIMKMSNKLREIGVDERLIRHAEDLREILNCFEIIGK